jgi:hypothetical protein
LSGKVSLRVRGEKRLNTTDLDKPQLTHNFSFKTVAFVQKSNSHEAR